MGADKLVESAERFGFNQDLDFPIVMYTSLMADPSEMTEWETAWAAAGEPVNPIVVVEDGGIVREGSVGNGANL